jgi:Putative zinc-finger
MEHQRITERHIPDLYIRGGLSAEEQSEFEEHLFDCQQCQEEVSAAQDFCQGLRDVLVKEGRRGPARHTLRTIWRRPSWLAIAAGILVAVGPSAGWWWYARGLSRELNHTKLFMSSVVAREQRSGAVIQQPLATLLEPQTGVLVFRLSGVRSSSDRLAPRPFTVPIKAGIRQVVFSLDVEPDPQLPRYRVRLRRGVGIVWESEALEPSTLNTLGIGLPSRILSAGDYGLSLEGITLDHRSLPIHRFLFRVIEK